MVLDDNGARVSTDDLQSRLFSDTRAVDGGFQSAVVTLRTSRVEPKDKRSVSYDQSRSPFPRMRGWTKRLSASLCLALFLLGPKVASKKCPERTLAQPR